MKIKHVLTAFAGVSMIIGNSQMVLADETPFMRSSIYTILVNSDEQNTRLDKEAKDTDPEGYQEAISHISGGHLGTVPSLVFPKIAIPEQFNDHNLATRILDFDKIAAGITPEQAAAVKPKSKGGMFGKMAKAAAAQTVASASGNSESSMLRIEKVDDYMHAAVQKFFTDEKVPAYMMAKWYDYKPDGDTHFDAAVITERGLNNASADLIAKGNVSDEIKAALSEKGFELINNTFVVATNLRFRNNKAVAKEISDMAGGIAATAGSQMGALGGLAALGAKKGVESMVNKLMKDQYSVTAVTHLYKLEWNDDLDRQLSDNVLYKEGATIDDLLKCGDLKLTYIGQTKARSGVKKDKSKTLEQLASTATERAIDKALAKLQVENEVFRTKVPVSKCEDGFVYAKIGSKEGVSAGDEYEILEERKNEKTGRIEYKKVGSAKVEKGGVWFNTAGAEELIANAEEKDAEAMKAAQALGYTKFKTGKKDDFSGYLLRLTKKKDKIED